MTIRSINAFLANSARTDLIGPEMWTAPDNERADANRPDGDAEAGAGAQVPHHGWNAPTPGMPGAWCYGHMTGLSDAISVDVHRMDADQAVRCRLRPVRHHWTPAGMTTHYRTLPLDLPGEHPFAGLLTVKERKCITAANVFIAELTLTNDHHLAQAYRVGIVTPHFAQDPANGARLVDCVTIVRGLGTELRIRADAALLDTRGEAVAAPLQLSAHQSCTFRYAFTLGPAGYAPARLRAEAALADPSVFERNAAFLDEWFRRNVPRLECGDTDLLKIYYYRWLLLFRSWHDPRAVLPDHPYPRPAFYESPVGRWFGCVIGLPGPMHLQEAAWLRDARFGATHIRNWAGIAHPQYRAYSQFTQCAIWSYFQNHPDQQLMREAYPAIRAAALAQVDPQDRSRLPVLEGSWPSGAEYQPNFYQFTRPAWDWRCDLEGHRDLALPISRMIRPDLATFTIGNLQAAARIATRLQLDDDAQMLGGCADAQLDRLKRELWDPRTGFFYAAHPETGALADQAPCYDGFLPFMWNLVGGEPYLRAFDRFSDPSWFWSEFPITTTAKCCPMYWSGNCLTGPEQASLERPHAYACCWNGPTWFYANSLAAEALGAAAATPEGRHLRPLWLEFLSRWSELHFLYGDRSVPCAIEHARPTDGARFRTIVDYFHSAWIDPFLRYWAGIRPDLAARQVVFDPFSTDDFELSGVPVLGTEATFTQHRNGTLLQRTIRDQAGTIVAHGIGLVTWRIADPSA